MKVVCFILKEKIEQWKIKRKIKEEIKRNKQESLPKIVFINDVSVFIVEKAVSAYNRIIYKYNLKEKVSLSAIGYAQRKYYPRETVDYIIYILKKNNDDILSKEEKDLLFNLFNDALKNFDPTPKYPVPYKKEQEHAAD